MLIKRKSILSGIVREREINVTQEQLDSWENGTFAQDAFPQLSADDREFIMSGITVKEWASLVEGRDECYEENESEDSF